METKEIIIIIIGGIAGGIIGWVVGSLGIFLWNANQVLRRIRDRLDKENK